MAVLSPWAPGSRSTAGGHRNLHHRKNSQLDSNSLFKSAFLWRARNWRDLSVSALTWPSNCLVDLQDGDKLLGLVRSRGEQCGGRRGGPGQTSGWDLLKCIRRESPRMRINHLSGTSDKSVIMSPCKCICDSDTHSSSCGLFLLAREERLVDPFLHSGTSILKQSHYNQN